MRPRALLAKIRSNSLFFKINNSKFVEKNDKTIKMSSIFGQDGKRAGAQLNMV